MNEEYKVNRIKEFTVGRKFKFNGIKYRVVEVDNENFMVHYKRLGFTLKRAYSGRRMKRYGCFGVTSTMDYNLKFLDGKVLK